MGAVVLQWYTKVKYITDLPLAYTLGVMTIDKRAFNRLDETDQSTIRAVMTPVYERFELRSRDDNREAEAALLANGLQVVQPDSAEVSEWRQVTARASSRLGAEGVFSPELLTQILGYLEDYRATAAGAQIGAPTLE